VPMTDTMRNRSPRGMEMITEPPPPVDSDVLQLHRPSKR
jgi:hypothetical protein